MNRTRFSQALLVARNTLGMTQKDFSKLVGVSSASISAWERGETPAARQVQKLSDVMKINIAELIIPNKPEEVKMKSFDEYEIVFRATVAIPKGEKIGLGTVHDALAKRMETVGYEKFLVGNTGIHATNVKD